MRVAVVGSSGFAGGAIASSLEELGIEVRRVHRGGEGVLGASLGDPASLAEAFEGCEIVVHAAGDNHYRSDVNALGWINVAGTENVLRAARHAEVRRMIALSCTDVSLHPGSREGWDEDRTPAKSFSAFTKTKLEAEEAVIGAGAYLETLVLRASLLWGPGDFSRLPKLLKEAEGGAIRLFGRGTNLVSTTYIGHLVQAVTKALESDAANGSVLHVLDGELTPSRTFYGELCEVLELASPKTGRALPLALTLAGARRGGDVPPEEILIRSQTCSLDGRRARQRLDFEPSITHAEGFVELRKWVKEVGVDAIRDRRRAPASLADIRAQQERARTLS